MSEENSYVPLSDVWPSFWWRLSSPLGWRRSRGGVGWRMGLAWGSLGKLVSWRAKASSCLQRSGCLYRTLSALAYADWEEVFGSQYKLSSLPCSVEGLSDSFPYLLIRYSIALVSTTKRDSLDETLHYWPTMAPLSARLRSPSVITGLFPRGLTASNSGGARRSGPLWYRLISYGISSSS